MNRSSASQLQFVILGCGLIGRKRAASMQPGQLRYACDLEAGRAESLANTIPGCTPLTDFRPALADPAVDAVIISTLNGALAPLALAAVRAGKHVLVEKPGALNAAQLRIVLSAAIQTGVKVRLGYNHRFHPALQKARELSDSVCWAR
jgi:predicted dehydrogenase